MLNKVMLIGRLGKDPESSAAATGTMISKFTVATNEYFSKNGERQERTEWHNIVAFGRNAENISRFLKKGSMVYIEGRLQTSSWEDNGVRKYRTEIICNNITFLDSRQQREEGGPSSGGGFPSGGGGRQDTQQRRQQAPGGFPGGGQSAPSTFPGEYDSSKYGQDDDVPF